MTMKYLAALACGACMVATTAAAQAQEHSQVFNVPSGSLSQALKIYSQQSGVQLIYRADDVAGAISSGVSGYMSREAALTALLAGTSFELRRDTSGAIAVVRRAAPHATAMLQPTAQVREVAPQPEPVVAEGGLAEIIVTAQKREQNLQSVPVAVSALDADALVANRITNVRDLNAVAPNLTIRTQGGGLSNPSYTMRGVVSGATAPGADKGVALYVDQVYLGSTFGSLIDLADIERIEVLKGPQGTLFGRNSTGGAISIITRDPAGEFKVRQEFTVGNYAQFRSKTRIDTPAIGPLSLSATYTHSERRGDIRNLGTGTSWDFSGASNGRWGTRVSPKYMGDQNVESFAAAAKLEISPSLKATYKFDWSENDYTPDGQGLLYTNFAALGTVRGTQLATLFASQDPDSISPVVSRRPSRTNNWLATEGHQRIRGHNLTVQWNPAANVTVRNILSKRWTSVGISSQLDGLGGLINTVPTLGAIGEPYIIIGTRSEYKARQWSNEIQMNWDTDPLTLTTGYFHYDDVIRLVSDGISFSLLPDFIYPVRGTIPSRVHVRSDAIFAQAEVHLMPGLDLVAGARQTWDRKVGTDNTIRTLPTDYDIRESRLTWSAGVNYQAAPNMFVYGKYSTGYISGGFLATFPYGPETAKSWEGGIKADWLDRKLRTNLAVFDVRYKNMHFTTSGFAVGVPAAPQVLLNGGDAHAYGFEFESTAVPVRGLRLGANAGYTHFEYTSVNPVFGNTDTFIPVYRPKWTGNLSAQYETEPVFRDGHLVFRMDGNYQSKSQTSSALLAPALMERSQIDASWILNGRIALADMDLSGATTQIALWGRNLTNNKSIAYGVAQTFLGSATFERARTYGIDITVGF